MLSVIRYRLTFKKLYQCQRGITAALSAFFFTLVMGQCVTNFDPKITENTPKLVIDGLITDQPGPYKIRLQYSYPYTNQNSVNTIGGATVVITDDLGATEKLIDRGQGLYETSATGIRGKVGREYRITIKTPNGKTFESEPELLKPVAEFGKFYTEYQETNTSTMRGQFNMFIDVKDPDSPDDFYRWKWTHYEELNYCLQTVTTSAIGVVIATRNKCCEPCWKIEACNGCIILANDRLTNGKTITKIPLGKIPYDDITGYFVLFEQSSLTEEAYRFWKGVDSQINNSGGIFDLPAATVIGNVSCTSHPEEQVLGYFGASSVVYKSLYVPRNTVTSRPYVKQELNWSDLNACYRCQESPYRTQKAPIGW
ncbi:MAG: DUF4249 domain-containing protein [Spirosomataceae bacterium]